MQTETEVTVEGDLVNPLSMGFTAIIGLRALGQIIMIIVMRLGGTLLASSIGRLVRLE